MKNFREYQIAFVGLKIGVHHFNYEIGDQFFSQFDLSLIEKGSVFADVSFEKKDRLFILNFDISGSVETDCDRCAEKFNLPIHGNYTIYIKIGETPQTEVEEEDVIWLGEGESIIELHEILYEFIHLSIPLRKVHPDKADGKPGCDEELLKKLGLQEDDADQNDPRWEILKSIHKN